MSDDYKESQRTYTQGDWTQDPEHGNPFMVYANDFKEKSWGAEYQVVALCQRKEDAALIAAAKDMLDALENLENDDGSIPWRAWELCQQAIAKARGEQ